MKIGEKAYGGIIADIRGENQLLIVADFLLAPLPWGEAWIACAALSISGHTGWRLPSTTELQGIFRKDLIVEVEGIGRLGVEGYWTENKFDAYDAICYDGHNFVNVNVMYSRKTIPVRLQTIESRKIDDSPQLA